MICSRWGSEIMSSLHAQSRVFCISITVIPRTSAVRRSIVALFLSLISIVGAPSPKQVVRFGSFEFDTESRNLSHEGKNISITAGEFDLLKVFTDHAKQPLSRDRIMQLAKGKELDVFDRSIDVQISRIRRLIEDNPNKPKYLQTKWGYGYIFDPDGEAQ